jgi:hypothetical protein
MNTKLTLIFLIVLTKTLHAQTKPESDLIIAIALNSTLPNNSSGYKAKLHLLDSIEKCSSARRFRKVKKLERLRNFIIVLEQVKLTDQSCLNNTYYPLVFDSVLPSEPVKLDSLDNTTTTISPNGNSIAAKAQANFEKKNSAFQTNQIKLLKNQQKILNDTRVKSDTLLRQLIKDQRMALEKEHRQRWEEEQAQCKIRLNESTNRLQIEVMNLKKIFARAYRRHLNKQKANETI